MSRILVFKSLSIAAISISPILVGFTYLPSSLEIQNKTMEISLNFPPTGKDRGAPATTAGGGTRSDDTACLNIQEGEMPLAALMPNRENIAKTATATPNLYWYVPSTKANMGELVIVDENGQEIYFNRFALPKQAGIIKLSIPAKANLKPGHTYSWAMMVVCDSRYRNRDKYVEGQLEYISLEPELKSKIKRIATLEQAKVYAQGGIWAETLDLIAQMRTEKPKDWQQLLKSVGLEKLADVPFLECCTTNTN
jgi:hypothetical protein